MFKRAFSIYVSAVALIVLVIFTGCSTSPESKGKALAERMNKLYEQYLQNRLQTEREFVDDFNPSMFSDRVEALKKYNSLVSEVNQKFQKDEEKILNDYEDVKNELLTKGYEKMTVFTAAYTNALNNTLGEEVLEKFSEEDCPQSVMSKIKTIIPSKPDTDKIKKDLATASITEGFERDRCWFNENQRWDISKFDIENFTITEVLKDSDKEYIFIASMRLTCERNAFDAKVKVSYTLPGLDDWTMEFVTSLGVEIVRTHKYDDLVRYEIKDDGWGGVDALYITNTSNVELVVGVDYVVRGNRRRSSVFVSPDKRGMVGGTFSGGSVTSYEIGFVERY